MINVCPNCGLYRADKLIEPDGPYAICPECGHRQAFQHLPLLMVAGASGAGKSAVCHRLLGRPREVVVLEADILWRPEFDRPEDRYREFFETWLRMCKSISQSGRPVVLFCAGGIPENVEPCVERRHFRDVHYLALTCDNQELPERLGKRPAWRQCGDPAYIDAQVRFNQWFREAGSETEPLVQLLDTTGVALEKTVEQVASWIREKADHLHHGFCSDAGGGLRIDSAVT